MLELTFEQPLSKLGFPEDGSRRRLDAVYGNTVFEHLSRTRSLRDLYYALTQCAMLSLHEIIKPVLILERPHISNERIKTVISQFLDLVRPDVAKSLCLVITHAEGDAEELHGQLTEEEKEQIPNIILHHRARKRNRRRSGYASFDILRVLTIHWLRGTGPITLKRLGLETGLSYPSVARSLDEFEELIEQESDRSVRLSSFPQPKWTETVINSPKARSSQGYYIPDGKPRSFDSLISRLSENENIDYALGGIHAARHYYPGIDLVGTPRLDITLHMPNPLYLEHLIRKLDPALRPVEKGSLPQVVIHQLDRPEPFFVKGKNQTLFSDEVDCLLDLHEARLEPQAAELLYHLKHNRTL